MLVIRLARTGRAKYPTYRIVAAESARAATGKFVAVLGHYNPHTKELVMNREQISGYLTNGAQPSNTVVRLLMREKVELPKWVQLKTKAAKPVETPAEPEAKAETAEAPAPAEAAEEAPAIEAEDERVAEVAEADAGVAEDVQPDSEATDTAS
ncbi:MAG TPA: 30S ribosomal protein S16 [Candidatus Saccharimonadia bacterium]|nr:30S ribosomal protein S16 [Candidatus Saccharimonadia bacterium]